jgi:hypothetical protein
VVGVYNKYRYDEEKKVALQKWEVLLLEILKTKPQKTDDIVKTDEYQSSVHKTSS